MARASALYVTPVHLDLPQEEEEEEVLVPPGDLRAIAGEPGGLARLREPRYGTAHRGCRKENDLWLVSSARASDRRGAHDGYAVSPGSGGLYVRRHCQAPVTQEMDVHEPRSHSERGPTS